MRLCWLLFCLVFCSSRKFNGASFCDVEVGEKTITPTVFLDLEKASKTQFCSGGVKSFVAAENMIKDWLYSWLVMLLTIIFVVICTYVVVVSTDWDSCCCSILELCFVFTVSLVHWPSNHFNPLCVWHFTKQVGSSSIDSSSTESNSFENWSRDAWARRRRRFECWRSEHPLSQRTNNNEEPRVAAASKYCCCCRNGTCNGARSRKSLKELCKNSIVVVIVETMLNCRLFYHNGKRGMCSWRCRWRNQQLFLYFVTKDRATCVLHKQRRHLKRCESWRWVHWWQYA